MKTKTNSTSISKPLPKPKPKVINGLLVKAIRQSYPNQNTKTGRKNELTQVQLAKLLGVGKETISRIESGDRKNISATLLCRMAELFACPIEYLLKPAPRAFKQKK